MILRIRKSKLTRVLCLFLIINFLTNVFYIPGAFALTGGPSQPEVQSFEPVGTSEMVDIPSGDFVYNIPLIDVGGYPVNLSYHSGITMDQEASWCGLGWNINPGVITRNMRSLPDDFNGDIVTKYLNMKTNNTYGVKAKATVGEVFGVKILKIGYGLGISYNNYKGVGLELIASASISSGDKSKPNKGTLGLGLNAGSENGVGLSPSLSFSKDADEKDKNDKALGASIGLAYNSRAGLQALTMGFSVEKNNEKLGKKEKIYNNAAGHNGNSSISFATPTYVPSFDMPMMNLNVSFTATFGTELFGSHANLALTGYYSSQFLKKKTETVPAYGFLYSHDGSSGTAGVNDEVMLDFNREKDGNFTENTPNLPLTNFTADVYSVAGQGIGGVYKPYRSDVGMVYDKKNDNLGSNIGVDGGVEIGAGNAARGGIDIAVNTTNTKSGKWSKNNSAATLATFKGETSDKLYEPYYFKQAGEKAAELDPGFFGGIGGYKAVRVALSAPGEESYALGRYVSSSNDGDPNFTPITASTRNTRQQRNQSISTLSAIQAAQYGTIKTIQNFTVNDFTINNNGNYTPASNLSRISYPLHHISEMSALRPDGARYVYGIPAYNNSQEEVSFALNDSKGVADCATGLVSYASGDNSVDNDNGLDNYFSRTDMPKYAHSYLLTSILSADYVDTDGIPGPSNGDYGTYTKINYSKAISNYKWRTPYDANKANYNEGMKSDELDDKANYIYGTKDIWYVHSIETKTHVAEFTLEDRDDGYGVQGPEGGRGGNSMKKLTEIKLYAKQDRIKNAGSAIPVKTVHFVYDYSLCPCVTNNKNTTANCNPNSITANTGKLTLKKLFFTYGNSNKGRLAPYKFNYETINPSYNLKGYDRWGNYMPNSTTTTCSVDGTPTNAEFPYSDQSRIPAGNGNYDVNNPDKTFTDIYSSAWTLSKIQLPSGGLIKVNYEADDYAFVQNKKAMRMFKVTGAGNSPILNTTDPTQLYDSANDGDHENNYLYFDLDQPVPIGTPTDYIKREYLSDVYGTLLKWLYFRFLVDLARSGGGEYEFVPGYAKIDGWGFAKDDGTNYTHGYVKLEKVSIKSGGDDEVDGGGVNPISKAAWQYARLYRPRIAYNQSDPGNNGFVQLMESMVAAFAGIKQMIQGINRDLRQGGSAKTFVPEKSFIRLNNPNGFKQGGGARVSQIVIGDAWKEITGETNYQSYEYGQEYDYTTIDAYGKKISSGVAAYEPTLGGDENPFRQPRYFNEDKILAPSDDYYKEEPIGESFFPSPGVLYSKVTVKNLQHAGVKRNATGSVVNEFYTAKDFPSIPKETPLKSYRHKPNPLFKILKIKVNEMMTTSQGYCIELNDMHGKPKAQWVYQEDDDEAISGVEYFYKTKVTSETFNMAGNTINISYSGLDNDVDVLHKNTVDGKYVSQSTVGVDYDFVLDSRESETKTISGATEGNLDAFIALLVPVAIPIILPSFAKEKTRYRSIVATKVINRYGLLDETIAHDVGARVSTKNLLYDAETGEILLTQTSNQFKDPVYSFTYPAHFAYDRMGPAYKNIGLTFTNTKLGSISNAQNYFVKWDELAIERSGGIDYGWVNKVNSTNIEVIDRDGNVIDGGVTQDKITIIRSGRRNQQTNPVGSITSLKNPLQDYNSDGKFDGIDFDVRTEVINASAVEFSDEWRLFCECGISPGMVYNPYLKGVQGIWRQKKSHLCLTDRIQTRANNNTNIRHDGVYSSFSPFWAKPNSATDWQPDSAGWTWTSQVTDYSPHGFELENKDALNRYSGAVYRYNNLLPIAVSSNSEYREIASDNFEDYDFGNCLDDHFSYKYHKAYISNSESHSGRRSINVPAKKIIGVKKVLIDCKSGTATTR